MPTARRCQGCGATLADPPAGSTSLTCPFCGLTHVMTQTFASPIVVQIGRAPQAPKRLGLVIGVVVAIVLGVTIVPIIVSMRMASSAIQQATSVRPQQIRAAEDARRPLKPAELADLSERRWKVSLPLTAILERARGGRGFVDRPFYSGYMIHLPREGWVWYFQAPSGGSFPRVRARDGRVFPY